MTFAIGRLPAGYRVTAAIGALALLAACAGVPATSAARPIERVGADGNGSSPDVRFRLAPAPDESPYNIVQDFLIAAGSPEAKHQAARQFLAPSTRWNDASGAIVLQKAPYLAVEENGASVVVRADQVAAVDAEGSYTPVTRQYSYRFRLEKVSGEWRIAEAPAGLLVSADDFTEFFRRVNLYFLDPSNRFLVPDPRWFAQPPDTLSAVMVNALLDGPSKAVAGAVHTDLTNGAALARGVDQTDGILTVRLTGLTGLEPDWRTGASAQLVWTLTQAGSGGSTGVEVYNDGQPLAGPDVGVQHVADWRSYDPDRLPALTSGYFIRDGSVWTTEPPRPIAGPAGQTGYGFSSVAISRDLANLAAIGAGPRGDRLYVGPLTATPAPVLDAGSLTPPTWGSSVAEVWTVRNGQDVLRVSPGREPQLVSAAALGRLGPVQSLRMSRDGCRVAVVAGPPTQGLLYVGAVTRGDGAVSIDHLYPVGRALTDVIDVAWSAADTLVALTGGGTDAALWTISVDGASASRLGTAGLPLPPSAVADLHNLPTLIVADGGIWQYHNGWTSLARSGAAPGSAPAYPD